MVYELIFQILKQSMLPLHKKISDLTQICAYHAQTGDLIELLKQKDKNNKILIMGSKPMLKWLPALHGATVC